MTQTDLLFTGQRDEPGDAAGLGLYNYRARFYSTLTGRFVSADPVQGLNRYAYVANNPLRYADSSGLYLMLACGWNQDCDDGNGGIRAEGSVEQWRTLVIEYWKSTGRFAGSDPNFIFDLFAGALANDSFFAWKIVQIFDVIAWDSSHKRARTDADQSARELAAFARGIWYATGEYITHLAGFSWGGVTVNEYLYGLSERILWGNAAALKSVYYVGAPDIHAANLAYNAMNHCITDCGRDSVFSTLGGPGNFNIGEHFEGVKVVARSAPIRARVPGLEVDLARIAGEITGGPPGEKPRPDEGDCHCVYWGTSYWDAQELFW